MINTINALGWDFQKNLERKPQWKKNVLSGTLAMPVCGPQRWHPAAEKPKAAAGSPMYRLPLPSSGNTHLKHHIKV